MLLGLDPSTTRFGFAFGEPNAAAPKSGVWHLPGASDLVLDRTLKIAFDSVASLCALIKPREVVIEAPIVISDRSAHTMVALMQLTGAVRAAALKADARIILVASSTVRKHFVNHGRPENAKKAVMDRCRMLRWEVSDDNAADACATWSWGIGSVHQSAIGHTPMFAPRGAA